MGCCCCRGRSRLTPEGYLQGAPELVVEVAASSASIDLGTKKRVYRRNGVQEYLVWQVFDQHLDWFYLEEGVYQPLLADGEGVRRSWVFPGLWLAGPPLLQNDLAAVLEMLQAGLRSPEHQAFAAASRG